MSIDLGHRGDAEVDDTVIDLAVNVRRRPMPACRSGPVSAWLSRLPAYPDATERPPRWRPGTAASPGQVLLAAGAAQAFVLLAQTPGSAMRRGDTFPGLVPTDYGSPCATLPPATLSWRRRPPC